MVNIPEVTLNNSQKMPMVGLGTFKANVKDVSGAVCYAIKECGYRHIDTASVYENEEGVGKGIKDSGIDRKDLFVTSKVWVSDFGFDNAIKACNDSLQRCGLEYFDLYLVHWPICKGDVGKTLHETWQALEKLYEEGKCKSIGISNFTINHMKDLFSRGVKITPQVNQFEFHPRLYQKELVEFCQKNNVAPEAYMSLGQGELLTVDKVVKVAKELNQPPANVLLKWSLNKNVTVIPKSVKKERIKANFDLFSFELTKEQEELLDSLHDNHHFCLNPYDKQAMLDALC